MSVPLPPSRLRARKAVLPTSAVPDGTRRRILEAALQLFASRGFHGASIRDLATALELRPSALYAHFSSKEHVLAELVLMGHEAHHEGLRAALLGAGSEPIEQLRALVRAHTLLHANHPQLAVVVNEEIHSLPPELAAPALALREQSAALLHAVIERGRAQGVFSVPHAGVTAAAISTLGLRLPYWYEPTPALDVDMLADLHVELSLRMLGVQGPPAPAS
ncbi:TetR/AcrR family transcriptional regulator [Corallococcus terminator]|uniref:TetR/AcrR family transcriptional regulator n=1 Tax=Corallococcus terminator TaxID=2316733 RepID=A0A3A8JR79_9BACT|nr:TetR/AcrR family transcriptional regulator [Corallococcus terminator]RKG92921.1 TetR/AcrR family transcriptional regulator [Corallococcus terminator]